MNDLLLQEALDVRHKTRANTFNWRGQFTPQLIEYLLANYANEGTVVADPFVGSGTVLAECVSQGLQCFGLEINPAAYTMSKFYSLANLHQEIRLEIFDELQRKVLQALGGCLDSPIWREGEDFRHQYANLIDFTRDFFPCLQRGHERMLGLNMLFLSESRRTLDLRTSICSALNYVRDAALRLPFSPFSVHSKLLDARDMHRHDLPRANLIITSPPYINVFNYHQNHRAILEAVGWDMLNVAASEFGSNRKNRGNRFKTVVQYAVDMEQALHSFWCNLRDEGTMIIIIGRESNVRGIPFYNGRLVKELAEGTGGFEVSIERERAFTNKFGSTIKEDVFVFKKVKSVLNLPKAKLLASQHLTQALNFSSDISVYSDIEDAIGSVSSISASPILQARKAALYA